MIPFLRIQKPDLQKYIDLLQTSVDQNHYSNYGPNERRLAAELERRIGLPVVLCANATLALDGIHDLLFKLHPDWKIGLPAFTFPATNLGCRLAYQFGKTIGTGTRCGFTEFEEMQLDAAITVAPFGAPIPVGLKRPDVKLWIIDNAAGVTPSMDRIRGWLNAGADIVVVSLHATKTLSACEGGFVVFKDESLREAYRRYTNFGFYVEDGKKQIASHGGSNHKMSELSAAWALMSIDSFEEDFEVRSQIADIYEAFCVAHGLEYIYSTQTFWMLHPKEAESVALKLLSQGIETRPYYKPLQAEVTDPVAITLSSHGLCLPTKLTLDEVARVVEALRDTL